MFFTFLFGMGQAATELTFTVKSIDGTFHETVTYSSDSTVEALISGLSEYNVGALMFINGSSDTFNPAFTLAACGVVDGSELLAIEKID